MTLADYANERQSVVLFWSGIGCPTGDYTLLGHPDFDFAENRGLLDLEGTVTGTDGWRWDGEGDPRDYRGNSILQLHAYRDKVRWDSLVSEWESGD